MDRDTYLQLDRIEKALIEIDKKTTYTLALLEELANEETEEEENEYEEEEETEKENNKGPKITKRMEEKGTKIE